MRTSGLTSLSPRERDVVHLLSQGKANKEIGYVLGLTEGTVKEYLNRIFKKLSIHNRVELAIMYVRGGNMSHTKARTAEPFAEPLVEQHEAQHKTEHGWQPIDTAPEGKAALFLAAAEDIAGHRYFIPVVARRVTIAPESYKIQIVATGTYFDEATLWHPLPDLPRL
jgi:DNA-binding CsgD family transcriptional regulator